MLPRIFQSVAHFIEDIEVVLDVLQRAVLRELMEQRFDLLFCGGHRDDRIALRLAISHLY